MPNLYIIAGCNGAGKTTASYTILPEILHCREFVNADNIAAGLSPFNPEDVALAAGRLMLQRIDQLISEQADFAFETTLSTRSYVQLIEKARNYGYTINLLFFWLSSPEQARKRVAQRVSSGGHNIPDDIVVRRYYRGIYNLINLYLPICDSWIVVDNEDIESRIIQKGSREANTIFYADIWNTILEQAKHGH